jgi:hypothetical protein
MIYFFQAAYTIDAGDIRLIRPLLYTREKALRDFSYAAGLPVIADNCPACFEEPKERHHLKKMLAREEALNPTLYSNLRQVGLLVLVEQWLIMIGFCAMLHSARRPHNAGPVGLETAASELYLPGAEQGDELRLAGWAGRR